jgi:AcrR family transcriptional regulator
LEQTIPTPRLAQRRRNLTRDALLEGGMRLFARREVDAVSIDDIVQEAGVAKGSFYNHFRDKEAFAREIGASVRRQAEDVILGFTEGIEDPAMHVALALCVFADFATRWRERARVLYKLNDGSTMPEAPINHHVRQVLQRGVDSQRFRGVDVECGLLLVMGSNVITVRHVLEERLVTPPAQIALKMTTILLRGLGLTPAQAGRIAAQARLRVFGPEGPDGSGK